MPTEEAEGTAGMSPFYPADNKNHKTLPRDTSLVWRERLICQQMYCLWLRNAYVTDDSAEIWKAAVSYYNVLYLAWGLWHARNEPLHQSLSPLTGKKKQHSKPLPSLKTEQFSIEENEVEI